MVEYDYDAWGNHTVSGSNVTLGNLNPFRYRSYYYDTETKLYFLQTRYYDPEVGRFLNMDSVTYADPETLNGLNLYAYCNNNPVMNVDPTGTFGFLTILLIVGLAFLVDTAVETTVLMTNEQYKAENVITRDPKDGSVNGVEIKNSAAFNNPIAQLVYANYLHKNVKNDDGTNFFTGDVYDIVGEWQAHNIAAQFTGIGLVATAIPSGVFGSGHIYSKLYDLHFSSVHANIGTNLAAEGRGLVRIVSQFFKLHSRIFSLNILNW